MSRLTPESIRAIQQEQHRYRSQRGFQHWANYLAFAALIEAGAEVMNDLADPISFWAATRGGPATLPGFGLVVLSHNTSSLIRANSRSRSFSWASSVGNSSGTAGGSSTIWQKITARAAASGVGGHAWSDQAGGDVWA